MQEKLTHLSSSVSKAVPLSLSLSDPPNQANALLLIHHNTQLYTAFNPKAMQLPTDSGVLGGGHSVVVKGSSRHMKAKEEVCRKGKGIIIIIRAELPNPSASVVISLNMAISLFLGRFVFFNFQRESDVQAKEYVGLLKSNDCVVFNIVDVFAWGSIGHLVAYYILVTSTNGYDPTFLG